MTKRRPLTMGGVAMQSIDRRVLITIRAVHSIITAGYKVTSGELCSIRERWRPVFCPPVPIKHIIVSGAHWTILIEDNYIRSSDFFNA